MIWGSPTNNVLEILGFDSDKSSKKDQGPYTKPNTHRQPIIKKMLDDNINLTRPWIMPKTINDKLRSSPFQIQVFEWDWKEPTNMIFQLSQRGKLF
jgi:hypothetical protein